MPFCNANRNSKKDDDIYVNTKSVSNFLFYLKIKNYFVLLLNNLNKIKQSNIE